MNHIYSKDRLSFAGYASPEAALETYCWAFFRADKQAILQSVTPEFKKFVTDKTEDQIKASVQGESMMGYIIKKREAVSDEMVLLHTSGVGRRIEAKFILKKVGNDWKLEGVQNDSAAEQLAGVGAGRTPEFIEITQVELSRLSGAA